MQILIWLITCEASFKTAKNILRQTISLRIGITRLHIFFSVQRSCLNVSNSPLIWRWKKNQVSWKHLILLDHADISYSYLAPFYLDGLPTSDDVSLFLVIILIVWNMAQVILIAYLIEIVPSRIMEIPMTIIRGLQAVRGLIGEITLMDRRIDTIRK